MKNIIIIGGGPSGIMSAISCKKHYPKSEVTILESNKSLGKKLLLTGGGRCNLTVNTTITSIIEATNNGKFLYSSLKNFSNIELMDFFKKRGVVLVEEDHQRIFPKSYQSKTILDILLKELKQLAVKIIYNSEIIDISPQKRLVFSKTKSFRYDRLIIATGGKSFPKTGSTGGGYNLAQKIGHSIIPLMPAEVALVSNDIIISQKLLQGISLNDVTIKVLNSNNKVVFKTKHDLLFTHFGLTGPGILQASYTVNKLLQEEKVVTIALDFTTSIQMQSDNLPRRLVKVMQDYHYQPDNMQISVYTSRGFEVAFVTAGGVNLKEIDPVSLKSKLDSRVSFCGEVLDLNSHTGGFNLTVMFSTGYTAGKGIGL